MMLLVGSCLIRRTTPVGSNGRRTMTDLRDNVRCLVLPMNDSTTIRHNFTLGRAFDVYFEPDTDLRVGDQIVSNGDKYTVRSVQRYNVPTVGHVRALCEQEVA